MPKKQPQLTKPTTLTSTQPSVRSHGNNPERSHETGFAKLPREKVAELGRRGGKKTKNDYKTTQRTEGPQVTGQFKIEQEEWTTAEDIQALYSPEDLDGPSISE